MAEHSLSITFKARYFSSGEVNENTTEILFALHGYGQLGQYFIRKFSALEKKNVVVIVPEGLSKFYLDPIDGVGRKSTRVGATWMTKENREVDIENYLTYLDAVFTEVMQKVHGRLTTVNKKAVPISVLGFSQGSATASRWILSKNIYFDRLILWAGVLPPDMNFELGSNVLKDKKVIAVYGNQDPLLTDSRFAEMQELTKKLNAKIDVVTFEGGHDIDEGTLIGLFS
jgi:predicted esterase